MENDVARSYFLNTKGFKTGGAMQEKVESFNSVTGEVKTVKNTGRWTANHFLFLSIRRSSIGGLFFVNDIQDQPRACLGATLY